ncbi:MAG: EMC3/TMCO1 family protein [Promethearchaeota archaeon]
MFAVIHAWADFIFLISRPPNSLWFIFLVCLVVSLLSTTLNKKLIDHDRAARIQEKVGDHNEKKKELLKLSETNVSRYAREYKKWQRQDESVKKMQQSMQMERLKPTCITFVPLMAFFFIIRSLYTPEWTTIQLPVALPPMNAVEEFPAFIVNFMRSEMYSTVGNLAVEAGFLGYTGWYMLCSFSLNSLIQKLFGISKTASGQSGSSLFDSSANMELPKPSDLR